MDRTQKLVTPPTLDGSPLSPLCPNSPNPSLWLLTCVRILLDWTPGRRCPHMLQRMTSGVTYWPRSSKSGAADQGGPLAVPRTWFNAG